MWFLETKYVIFKRVDILTLKDIPKNTNKGPCLILVTAGRGGGGEGDSLSKLLGVSKCVLGVCAYVYC